MIFLTGDKHGSFNAYRNVCRTLRKIDTTKDDYIIILGDAGLNYYNDERDEQIKKKAEKIPATILCIHGNHEIRPETLSQYEEKQMFGGKVFIEDRFPSIIFLQDREVYTIENKTFLVLGGAYSVDKYFRLTIGNKWFADEQISIDKREEIIKKIKGKSFDYILSHTCPYEWQPFDMFLPSVNQDEVDNSTEKWLSDIERNITYKEWFFGHFHADRKCKIEDKKYRILFNDISLIE